MSDNAHQVRVRIGQVPYTVIAEDSNGNHVPQQLWAYGPGMPQIDPDRMFEDAPIDPESDKFKAAAEDFHLGQLIEINDDDYARLKGVDAVKDVGEDGSEEEDEDEDEELDVGSATVEELSSWIRTTGPTVNEVVQASGGSAEYARKLLEAESKAQDGEARQGVVKGLSAVISRGE